MSFHKKDRKVQSKIGKSFHVAQEHDDRPFAELIAAAMLIEWGATPSARKEVGRITGANERAVRNWFEGKNGPSGDNLVALIRYSDEVLKAVLERADRHHLSAAASVFGLREPLVAIVAAIDRLGPPPPAPS
jgi:hypothetical protein